ncbi:hypothetical protein QTN25_003857 [Entamoeba marina]
MPMTQKTFYELKSVVDPNLYQFSCQFKIEKSGVFQFKILNANTQELTKIIYINVYPEIQFPTKNVPVGGLSIQTNIVRVMGKLKDWESHYQTLSECGYNAVHLTPVQPIGPSGSAYSIVDRDDISDLLFDDALNKQQKLELLQKTVTTLRNKYNVASIIDIVLSHISSASPVALEHPEICYTIDNCPHLKVGYGFDKLLHQCINDVINSNYPDNIGIFKKPSDVKDFMTFFKENYMIPATRGTNGTSEELAERIIEFVSVDGSYERIISLVPDLDGFIRALDVLNVDYYRHYDNDVNAAIQNCENNLNYSCFNPSGPRHQKFTKEEHILPYYFQVIEGKNSRGESVSVVAAHHGWIFGGDPFFDFVGDKNSKVYIRREAIVWEDSLKLNYGNTYVGHEYLWDHMASYAKTMAKLFDGFRLDNCHSVPLVALEYILEQSRQVNNSLVVLAELFADNQDAVTQYVVRCGIQGLVREALHAKSATDLNGVAYQSSWFKPVGGIYEEFLYDELPADPQPMDGWTYDLTHDNEPQEGSRNSNDSLATSAVVAMTIGCTGSVRGYDELVPYRISCVTETRTYRKYNWSDKRTVGISAGKKSLNQLHERLAVEGYTEFYAETNGNVISLTRRNPHTNKIIVMYVHTSFVGNYLACPENSTFTIPDYKFSKFLFFGALTTGLLNLSKTKTNEIYGNQCICDFSDDFDVVQNFLTIQNKENAVELKFLQFPHGSIVCFELDLLNPPNPRWEIPKCEFTSEELTTLFFQTPDEIGVPPFHLSDGNYLKFVGLGGVLPLLCNDLSQPLYRKLRDGVLEHLIPYLTQQINQTTIGIFLKNALNEIAPLLSPNVVPSHVGINTSSLCAGHTHFSTGYMRNWGRDTFISLRGLLLQNHRYKEAENTICGYLCALRHGLIPNLLDGGVNPRYNARDATWFCLGAIVDYCRMVPNGKNILEKTIYRIDISQQGVTRINKHKNKVMTVVDCIQEILEAHANGIHFREKNAGPQIDSVMTSEGFNVDIVLDKSTGMISGGSESNCGTWMDKMGSSHRAGNSGFPGSSRDGADVEIQGLLMKVLHWINTDKVYPYDHVKIRMYGEYQFKQWEEVLVSNFHKHFYKVWPDYQLRPNFLVTLVEAPELFVGHEKEVKIALQTTQQYLVGPLGMRTLDPTDWNYRPDYYNDDNDDFATANGLNYHNGPEWVWPYGYYVMAVLMYNPNDLGNKELLAQCRSLLFNHCKHITNDVWMSLPELTNKNGSPCYASCASQAWSIATVFDAVKRIEESN